MEMTTFWDYRLIALSIVIAIVGSYLALDFAGRLKTSHGKARRNWFLAGALTMGLGIWSMHFVGMLALQMSIPVSYDPYFMFLSIVAAAVGAGIAFFILNRQSVGSFPLVIASIAMGLAIASMHYIGMASMKMPAKIQYDPFLFALSIGIAIIASGAALRIAFQLRQANPTWVIFQKIGSAVLMGFAISGMHYTGMAAASYIHADSMLGGLNRDPMVGNMPLEHLMVLAAGVFGLALVVLSALIYAEHQRTLATLQESELRFRNLADTAPMYMAMADETGSAVYFNKPWLDWTGRTMEEMKGLGWLCTLHPEDAPKFERDFKQAFVDQVPIDEEYRFRRADGEYRWMKAVGAPRFDPDGRFIGYFGTYTDFHELKETQLALQKSEERYQLVIEGSNDGIWDWDHEAGTIFWSKRCYDQLGVPYDTIITPEFFLDRIHPEDRPRAMQEIRAHLEKDKPYDLEIRMRHESGKYGYYLARGMSVRDSQGKVIRTAGVRTDITKIKQAEEALQRVLERERLTRRVAELANQTMDLKIILNTVAQYVGEFFQVDRAFVLHLEQDGDTYRISSHSQYCRSEDVCAYDQSGMSAELQAFYSYNNLMGIVRVSTPQEYEQHCRKMLESYDDVSAEQKETLCREMVAFNVEREQMRALLRLPITYRGTPYGNIVLHQCLSDRVWTDEEVAILQELATQVGTVFYQAEISQKEKQANDALQKNLECEHLIRKVVEVIGQSFDINLILKTVAEELGHHLQVDRASVSRYYMDEGKLILDASAQYTREGVKPLDNEDLELLMKAVQHLTPEALTQGEPQITNIANQEEYVAYMRERMSHFNFPDLPTEKLVEMIYKYEIQASLRVSIRYRGIPYGSISVSQTSYNRQWQPEEIELLKTLADHAASAIFQAELYRQEQQANREARIRAEQQEVVTELGLKALSGIELHELMEISVDAVAKTLDVEYCKLLESLPTEEDLLLRAGYGWQEGLVGSATESAGLGSPAGYTLLKKEPIIVEDLRTETRFSASSLLLDHNVVSGISVVIFTFGNPWGVMGAYSGRTRKFSKQDVNFFQAVANVIATAIERKQIEQEKERAKEEAETANRKKSEFLAMMSHELRTPLNSILGYSRMIENGMGGPLTEDQAKYIRNVGSSGSHLLNIVNDLLDVSKVEAGKMVISPGPIDVKPVIHEIQSMMEDLAQKNDVYISFQIQPGINTIEADPSRFKQILINLTSNAIKFNKKGGSVSVRLNKSEDDEWLIGEVQDTGIGIPKDKQTELFKKFYQVDTTASRPHEGTGLGLALTKDLIELHGGEIRLESEEGIGSTFTFRLPARARIQEKVGQA